jgi:hypothetical protein
VTPTATPTAPPIQVLVVDNGDTSYSTTGLWNTWTGVGAQGDFDYKNVGSGLGTATWTLGGLAAGDYYRVSVTWEPFANRTPGAPYTVFDGATPLETVLVNQRQTPADFSEGGVDWQDLGSYQVFGDTLVVHLSDAASPQGSRIIADAARVERLAPPTATPTATPTSTPTVSPTVSPTATPTVTPTPTPEPGLMLQLVSGAVGLAWLQRRRNRRVRARSRS